MLVVIINPFVIHLFKYVIFAAVIKMCNVRRFDFLFKTAIFQTFNFFFF